MMLTSEAEERKGSKGLCIVVCLFNGEGSSAADQVLLRCQLDCVKEFIVEIKVHSLG